MGSSNKIVFVISTLGGGGAEGVCTTVASGLADLGLDIELLVLNLRRAVYQDRLSSNVKLTSLNVSNARYSFLPLIKHLRKTKPERVVVFNYELAIILVLIRPFLGFKFQLIARNINTVSASLNTKSPSAKKRALRALVQRLYCKVDHVINQCEGMRKDLLNTLGLASSRTSVIYNPVNEIVEKQAQGNGIGRRNTSTDILCIGRLEPQKSFDLAITAFAVFATEYPDYRLIIAGQGSLEKDLKQLVQDLSLADKVNFVGFQADTVHYFSSAKFTLLTSLYEGFPNVLVESITLGTPVVSVNCPSGPDEIVVNGVNGYLVEDRTVDSIADAMKSAALTEWDHDAVKQTAEPFSRQNILAAWQSFLSGQRE
ncbi:Glycosyltransferase involved in cell wall bisynthesis [Arsukibacterium tuosuense]|uniref:Glycosyltransferase involved in cell wall bisynthesis n=1 Tax=Arsukibacterium tuosuense TaxID=1323745 RepID=A0A285IY81_9GAMM|nr:glycosyltransferase [Arsukibacterium tuosuense]SNY51861.1 Glycosyltransferase involved in cell wall bisynthesis [Arsukibacterium tuosuense]